MIGLALARQRGQSGALATIGRWARGRPRRTATSATCCRRTRWPGTCSSYLGDSDPTGWRAYARRSAALRSALAW